MKVVASMWRLALTLAFASTFLVGQNLASAADFPTRPVRFVVPFAAGGSSDVVARKLGQVLSAKWHQPVIIENISGAANIIAINTIAHAAPDGYTFMLVTDVAVSLYPLMYKKLPYDTDRDLTAITTLTTFPAAFAVSAKAPVSNLKEFVAYAKKSDLNYGSFGPGSAPNLHTELFKSLEHVNLVQIPYRGVAPAVQAMLQGQIQVLIVGVGTISSQVNAGNVKALAVDGDKRSPLLPNVPTFKEAGMPDMVAPNWWGLMGPAKMPPEIVAKIAVDVGEAMKNPLVATHLAANGYNDAANTPEELRKRILDTRTFWSPIVKKANIQLD